MVKVERSLKPLGRTLQSGANDVTQPSQIAPAEKKSKRRHFTNSNLPAGAQDQDVWRKLFIPTYARWLGRFAELWNIDEAKELVALQQIWDTIYRLTIQYTIKANDAVVAIVRIPSNIDGVY
jgi:hypothetical protein